MMYVGTVPTEAVALQLHRIVGERLLACEEVEFVGGYAGLETTLRRAAVSGRVEVEGEIKDHFADLHDERGNLIATVALDSNSYRSLKTRWARCKLLPES